jgi:hypothetical protein
VWESTRLSDTHTHFGHFKTLESEEKNPSHEHTHMKYVCGKRKKREISMEKYSACLNAAIFIFAGKYGVKAMAKESMRERK